MRSAHAMAAMMPSIPAMAAMMSAMMLPGALPAIVRSARARHTLLAALRFAASYLGVWFACGLATFALYERPRPSLTIAVLAAAVLYELTPAARVCRRRCRAEQHSGARYGLWCVGSSLGLMAAFVALDPMSLSLMCLAGTIALIQNSLSALLDRYFSPHRSASWASLSESASSSLISSRRRRLFSNQGR
jgi:predicted metal-binding membrane protein